MLLLKTVGGRNTANKRSSKKKARRQQDAKEVYQRRLS